jgi:translocation and assembly module TamB
VPELTGVRRRGEPLAPPAAAEPGGLPSAWKLDIAVQGVNQLFVTGMGLDSEWRADLRIGGDLNRPVIAGQVQVVRGSYSFAGRRLDLSRGVIQFTGQSPIDPQLNIQADTTVNGVQAIITIGGSAQDPQISFSSVPALPQDEVLARLLFGSSAAQLSGAQALQLGVALNSLRGSGGGLNPLGELRRAAAIDRLNILGADQASGRGTAISAGKYISNNVYVEVVTDARGFTAVQIEVALSRALSVLSQVSSLGGQSLNLRYSKDY